MTRKHPFGFLDKCIHVLCIDDEPAIHRFFRTNLRVAPYCRLTAVSSLAEADRVFRSEPVHCCFHDLGLQSGRHDEYDLLEQYGESVSIIVFSGSTSLTKGFVCREKGACHLVEKGVLSPPELLEIVRIYALYTILGQGKANGGGGRTFRNLLNTLFESEPLSVTEWVTRAGLTESYARKTFRRIADNEWYRAKYLLCVYHLVSMAFRYTTGRLAGKRTPPAPDADHGQFIDYFLLNLQLLQRFFTEKVI